MEEAGGRIHYEDRSTKGRKSLSTDHPASPRRLCKVFRGQIWVGAQSTEGELFGQNGREELPAIERRKALKTQVPRHRPCSFNSQCVAKSGINVAHVTIPANDTFKLVIKNRSEIIGHDH